MKLSTRSRYGLRLMFELALKYGKGPVLLKVIAERQGISEKYLSKLVIPLRGARLIISVRGMHGGYMLARSPKSITAMEIVETLEGGLALEECRETNRSAGTDNASATQSLWCRLEESIRSVLSENTLETLVDEYRAGMMNQEPTFDI
jgi:Rrf2 family transcriptional regulator, cysteine metabolism repressor